MEDSNYTEYFSGVLPKHSKSRKDASPPPKMQLKTEGQEPDDHRLKVQYDSCSRVPVPKSRQEDPSKSRLEVHQEAQHSNTNSRQEAQHSKINLNRSMSHKADPEMEETRSRLKALESKVSSVLEENKVVPQ